AYPRLLIQPKSPRLEFASSSNLSVMLILVGTRSSRKDMTHIIGPWAVYWRVIRRGDKHLYLSTFPVMSDQAVNTWDDRHLPSAIHFRELASRESKPFWIGVPVVTQRIHVTGNKQQSDPLF